MTAFDFSPLFRTAIGFDRLANALESANRADAGGYPPYNIEMTGEDQYRISLAVAGFGAFGAFLFALFRGKLSVRSLMQCLFDTGKTTAMIFFIIIG